MNKYFVSKILDLGPSHSNIEENFLNPLLLLADNNQEIVIIDDQLIDLPVVIVFASDEGAELLRNNGYSVDEDIQFQLC